jgi:hypothetical protein
MNVSEHLMNGKYERFKLLSSRLALQSARDGIHFYETWIAKNKLWVTRSASGGNPMTFWVM